MMIAFSGLFMSSVMVLNQFSFIMVVVAANAGGTVDGCSQVVAVMLDTFVIRTILVPVLIIWLGEAHWWPLSRSLGKPLYDETRWKNSASASSCSNCVDRFVAHQLSNEADSETESETIATYTYGSME